MIKRQLPYSEVYFLFMSSLLATSSNFFFDTLPPDFSNKMYSKTNISCLSIKHIKWGTSYLT